MKWFLAGVVFCAFVSIAAADPADVLVEPAEVAVIVDADSPSEDETEQELEKQRTVSILLFTLVGIVICGIALIALAIILGNRIRRMARQPLPRQSKLDDLWFLKPNAGHGGAGHDAEQNEPSSAEKSSQDEETNTA